MADSFQAFCERYGYDQLNTVQKEAIQCVEGAGLLFSVPGSGKTTVIVARAGYMVYGCGICPENILVITFTKAAAEEMRLRYRKKFSADGRIPDFRTIHSFCYRMIREMARSVGGDVPEILNSPYKLIERILRDHRVFVEKEVIESIVSKITEVKNRMMSIEDIREIQIDSLPAEISFEHVFDEYKKRLKADHMMDQDDLLVYARGLMRKYPELLKLMQERYPYVSVDEAQDTSPLQHRIIEQFCSVYGNIFMVGDDDQSIYGFRGADPEELIQFGERWKNAKQLTMNINYRSDKKIVEKADAFISHNEHRTEKKMIAHSSSEGEVRYPTAGSYYEQIQYLMKEVREAKESGESLAILFRQNVSGYALQYAFEREGITCNLLPIGNLVSNDKTVRDVIHVLEFAFDRTDIEKFEKCYSALGLYLSRSVVETAKRLNRQHPNEDILKELAANQLGGRESRLMLNCNGRLQQLTEMNTLCALETLVRDVNENIIKSARSKIVYEFLKIVARDYERIEDFIERIEKMDEMVPNPSENIVLSTLHSCKGLEFDRVIMIDLLEDVIPGKTDIDQRLKACETREEKKRLQEEEDKRIEEEARLFYVGVTRARHELSLLIRQGQETEISQFVIDYRGKDMPVSAATPASGKTQIGPQTRSSYIDIKPQPVKKANIGSYLNTLYPYGVPEKK